MAVCEAKAYHRENILLQVSDSSNYLDINLTEFTAALKRDKVEIILLDSPYIGFFYTIGTCL